MRADAGGLAHGLRAPRLTAVDSRSGSNTVDKKGHNVSGNEAVFDPLRIFLKQRKDELVAALETF